jgi:D-serine deaminase-like pyridoxal phosphate-dependent protein
MDARSILHGERLPAVVVDLDAFDRNVAHAARVVRDGSGEHTLRLATKSVRVPALIRRALDHGAPFQGLMCFSAEEVRFLASQGFDDLLLAYPTVQPSDLAALRQVHAGGTRVIAMVDALDQLQTLSQAMAGLDQPLPVAVDVDMSLRIGGAAHLGVRRSPIRTVDQVVRLFEQGADLPGVRMMGLMGYDAQVAGLADRNPFKKAMNPVFRLVRHRSVASINTRRRTIAEALRARGFELELFNGGGTGSLDIVVGEPWLTEVTAGSGLLCSHLFDYYSNIRFEPAFFFALQVVRSSDPTHVTCQGGGYIASGEPGWDKVPIPHDPPGLKLVAAEGSGEVQTPLRVPSGVHLEPGDAVLFRPAKAGELAERFQEYLLVSGGEIVERAKTYRGFGECYY